MVGVAADVGIVGGGFIEADAAVVLVARIRPERMDVGKEVAAGAHAHADAAIRYAHVGERVVVSLDPYPEGVVGAVADDMYVADVAVRGSAVCAVLDAEAERDVLHRNVLDAGLAAGLDEDAGGASRAVDDAAREGVDAAGFADVVRRMNAAETHEGLAVLVVRSGLEDGEVRELERDGEVRVGGG